MLLRSGVGRLRLVDFDQVTLSSLNRHAVATRADVGTPKAVCLQRHFRRIMPEAEVEAVVEMFTEEGAEGLLSGAPTFVVDAIDNIDTKVALLAGCKARGLPVLCVAGAGAKADPTRLRFVDLAESSYDALARAVRHKLRRDRGIGGGIPVLLSTEKARCQLVAVVPNFRVRTIPVLGTTPAAFGMAAAGYVLCHLAQAPFEGEPIVRLDLPGYERALLRLENREAERFGSAEGVAVDLGEVAYLVRELWRGCSARAPRTLMPGGDKGLLRSTGHLALTRWDKRRPATVDNLVLLTTEEADAHDAAQDAEAAPGAALEALAAAEPRLVAGVEAALARARHDFSV